MTPILNETYIGPFNQKYRVEGIDERGKWVTIRRADTDKPLGTIKFAMRDAAKWLAPVERETLS